MGIWAFSIFLTIGNNSAVNDGVQVSVWAPVFNSLGHIPRNGTIRPYDNSA